VRELRELYRIFPESKKENTKLQTGRKARFLALHKLFGTIDIIPLSEMISRKAPVLMRFQLQDTFLKILRRKSRSTSESSNSMDSNFQESDYVDLPILIPHTLWDDPV
jgi:hypothetical protein